MVRAEQDRVVHEVGQVSLGLCVKPAYCRRMVACNRLNWCKLNVTYIVWIVSTEVPTWCCVGAVRMVPDLNELHRYIQQRFEAECSCEKYGIFT